MSLDERLESELMGSADGIHTDPGPVLRDVVTRGRRRRTLRRVATGGVALVLGALAFAAVALDIIRLPGRPGPSDARLASAWGPEVAGRPGCVFYTDVPDPRFRARDCGLFPPTRRSEESIGFKLTTVDGDSFWLVADDELGLGAAADGSVLALPEVPIFVGEVPTLVANVTTAPLAGEPEDQAALDRCVIQLGEPCTVEREFHQLLPSGDYWDKWRAEVDGGAYEFHTVDTGTWTLVIDGVPQSPDPGGAAEPIIRNLEWEEDADGYIRMSTADSERAPLEPESDMRLLLTVPDPDEGSDRQHAAWIFDDCEVGGREYGPEPVVEQTEAGSQALWCTDEGFLILLGGVGDAEAERFHDALTVVGSLPEPVELASP